MNSRPDGDGGGVGGTHLLTALLVVRVPLVGFVVRVERGGVHRVQAFGPLAVDGT